MAADDRPRILVTLSPFALAQIKALAKAKGLPPGRVASQIVEAEVDSPRFGQLVRRAIEWKNSEPEIVGVDEDDDD